MAEINKLDVGKALDKMRGAETPKARMVQLDEKIGALEEETRRMRAMSRQLERTQKASSIEVGTKTNRMTTTKIVWTVLGIVVVIPILAWAFGLLSR
jgi:hypothetical protein